jgi:alcohol dehydrogenase class IV
VLALNAPAVPDLERRLADAFAADSALGGLLGLRRELGAPRSLRELGLHRDDISRAVQPVLEAVPPGNPAPVTAENVLALLEAAWAGEDPA